MLDYFQLSKAIKSLVKVQSYKNCQGSSVKTDIGLDEPPVPLQTGDHGSNLKRDFGSLALMIYGRATMKLIFWALKEKILDLSNPLQNTGLTVQDESGAWVSDSDSSLLSYVADVAQSDFSGFQDIFKIWCFINIVKPYIKTYLKPYIKPNTKPYKTR